jgi:hypothetical protein
VLASSALMSSLAELQASRLRASAEKADARASYLLIRAGRESQGVAKLDDDPLVMRALAVCDEVEVRYEAARREHSDAVEAARISYESGEPI